MTCMTPLGLTILFYFILLCCFILFILFYSFIYCNIASSFFGFILFIFVFIVGQETVGCCSTLTEAHALKESKKNNFGRKGELMWLHTYGKRRSYMEMEKHSDFQKGREVKERKVDFLHEIEFLGGWYRYKNDEDWRKEKKMKRFSFSEQIWILGADIYIRNKWCF